MSEYSCEAVEKKLPLASWAFFICLHMNLSQGTVESLKERSYPKN